MINHHTGNKVLLKIKFFYAVVIKKKIKTYGEKGAASIESITVITVTVAKRNNTNVNCFCILMALV